MWGPMSTCIRLQEGSGYLQSTALSSGLCLGLGLRAYIGVILGIMEKNMETTIMSYIGLGL